MTASIDAPVKGPITGALQPLPRVRLRRFLRNRLAVAGATFLLLLIVLALFPSLFVSSPSEQDLGNAFERPSAQHLLGKDNFGRDQLSRVVYGARTSLFAAVQGTAIAMLLGVPFGMIGAYMQGRTQFVFDRINEMLMSVPALLLAIVIIGTLGPSLSNAMIAIGVALSPRFYRMASAATQDVRAETFLEASRAIGCSRPRILLRHVLPNISNSIIVQASLTVGSVILAEASLSFIGFGVQPPTPSWGGMLHAASGSLYEGAFLVYGPGLMVVLTVLACQLASDGLRDALGGTAAGGQR